MGSGAALLLGMAAAGGESLLSRRKGLPRSVR